MAVLVGYIVISVVSMIPVVGCITCFAYPVLFGFHLFLGYKGFVATKEGACFEYPFVADKFPPAGPGGNTTSAPPSEPPVS